VQAGYLFWLIRDINNRKSIKVPKLTPGNIDYFSQKLSANKATVSCHCPSTLSMGYE